MSAGPFDAGIPVLTEVLQEIPAPPVPPREPATVHPPAAAFKPAVWRTGVGAASVTTAPAPVIDLVVPAEADLEAGTEAITETGTEAGTEAGAEAGMEPAVDAPPANDVETGVATGIAAGIEAGTEAGAEAGAGAAAGVTVDMQAGAETEEAAPSVERAGAVDLAAIEQALSERIVQQLMPRVDALVAERFDQVLQQLAGGLQAGLAESVAQAVAASVRQELAALQAPKP
ncbi:hypothetical protein GCM10007387_52750 [Pseudoduganella albidiflava]|uniref:DUF2486 family protein n=1 Tax=Pseudoduganella albidiflava TaxID=321983 RepID=A0AA88C5C3_9BURK|nr:hypothetical protein GCM10007387_52750 [Pseudoduganella albidiflava]